MPLRDFGRHFSGKWLLLGVHNAWDTVTYLVLEAGRAAAKTD